jgi:hypothetical protein
MKRLNLILLCLLIVIGTFGQEKKKKTSSYNKQKQNQEDEKFLEKQWWLGFKAGANLSKANVDKTYSIIAPTNYDASDIGKQYDNYRLLGSQATLEVPIQTRLNGLLQTRQLIAYNLHSTRNKNLIMQFSL